MKFSLKSTAASVGAWVGQRLGFSTISDRNFWSTWAGGGSWSGETVTAERAMQLSAVYRAVRLTAETMACLPLKFYEDTTNGPVEVVNTDFDDVFRISPNQDQTPVEFWEQLTGCQELVGNGYARKVYVGAPGVSRLIAAYPLNPLPGRMNVVRNVSGGLEYRYNDEKGKLQIYSPDEILHLKGFSMGGDIGMSTVQAGAQSMGLSIAAEKAAGRLFKSGLRSSGFIESNAAFDEPDRERLERILKQYTGAAQAGSIMLLEGGMKYTALSMSAQDAELLLTRKFEIEEIGRLFGMPGVLLGHAPEGQTMFGTGVESVILSWLTLGLNSRIVRTEAAIQKRGMSAAQARRFYAKHNIDALLRADSAARGAFMSVLAQNAIMTRNELRKLLDKGPLPGGDVLTAQVNLVPLAQLGQDATANQVAQARQALIQFLQLEDKRNENA
jgi:HK97 family phage portal protein